MCGSVWRSLFSSNEGSGLNHRDSLVASEFVQVGHPAIHLECVQVSSVIHVANPSNGDLAGAGYYSSLAFTELPGSRPGHRDWHWHSLLPSGISTVHLCCCLCWAASIKWCTLRWPSMYASARLVQPATALPVDESDNPAVTPIGPASSLLGS